MSISYMLKLTIINRLSSTLISFNPTLIFNYFPHCSITSYEIFKTVAIPIVLFKCTKYAISYIVVNRNLLVESLVMLLSKKHIF